MSAAEIIEQIKALPLEEQIKVSRFVQSLSTVEAPMPAIRYATDEQALAAADHILKEHEEVFRKLAE